MNASKRALSEVRELPLHHLSIRVPWHDRGWDGSVCADPKANTSCLALRRIGEEKNDEAEHTVRAKFWKDLPEASWPACTAERGAFMAPFEITRNLTHPYASSSKPHQRFDVTPLTQPPYSVAGIPFKWMLTESAIEAAERLKLPYDDALEDAIHEEMGFKTHWVQTKRNQLLISDTFFSAVKPEESLCFFYAKDTPLATDPRRVIVGIGRVKAVHAPVEYRYKGTGEHEAIIWDRIVQHSIRPEFTDGFLFPYREILKLAEADPTIDPATLVAFAPEECRSQFSFATEHVTHDGAVAALLACHEALRRIGEKVPGRWQNQIDWIDRELNRIWRLRGPFPGLGSALKAFGVDGGNLIAYDLASAQQSASAEWSEDPWTLVTQVMEQPDLLRNGLGQFLSGPVREMYRKLPPKRRALLQLLSRFDISEEQAARYYQETERQKAGLDLSDDDILGNPYRLYEADRRSAEPVSFAAIDRGLFPDDVVGARFPVPSPSAPDGSLDPRRVRALLVRELEEASRDGHTLRPRGDLIQQIRDLELRPACAMGSDALPLVEPHLAPEVRIVEMADGAPAYQLGRLSSMGEVIRKDILKRIGGRPHELSLNWRNLVDDALPGSVDSEEEELARQEKAAALEQLFKSRVSVLIGPAGTGKTTLLRVLCNEPGVKGGGVLLLAPTGKARVRMETQIGIQGAKTIAQFLVPLDRYVPETGEYRTSSKPKQAVGKTVIIDEASMLTEEQLGAVLDAIQPPERLVFVGDPKQLPPIGSGRPFVDIVARLAPKDGAGAFPLVAPGYAELTIPRRHKGEDRQDLLLASWFAGRSAGPGADAVWNDLAHGRESSHLRLVRWDTDEELESILLRELTAELPLADDTDEVGFERSIGGGVFEGTVYFNCIPNKKLSVAVGAERWQILSPVRGGIPGVERLNRLLHDRFRTRVRGLASARGRFRKVPKPFGRQGVLYGDKVINLKNKRRRGWPEGGQDYVSNGEIGVVVGEYKGRNSHLKKAPKKIEVEFSSQQLVKYSFDARDFSEEGDAALELAYALTIHKCQGSEFGKVFVVVPNPCRLLSPELLYTALTRQRDRVVLLHQGPLLGLKNYSQGHLSETARRLTNLFEAPRPVKIEERFLEDRLIHRTRRGEAVRSKSEVVIADLLHSLSVDYRYEAELTMEDGSRRLPDFTIDDPASGLKVYWEHLGMLNVPRYREQWQEKLAWYRRNGIAPASEGGGPNGTLVITEDDPRGGIDSGGIERLAREVLGL
ncbi:MAG: AAA family ATPase [Vicinamibacterales bacterium]